MRETKRQLMARAIRYDGGIRLRYVNTSGVEDEVNVDRHTVCGWIRQLRRRDIISLDPE